MDIASVMTRDPVTVSPDCTLERASSIMAERELRHLPIVEHGRLVGILSERDFLEATGWDPERYLDRAERRSKVARDAMSVPVETLRPDDELATAAAVMLGRRIGCVPILRGGELVGVLSEADLLRAYVDLVRQGRAPVEREPLIGTIMSRELLTVDAATRVSVALALCRANHVRHLPVIDDGWFVGIVSDRDLLVHCGRGDASRRTAGDAMTIHVVALRASDRLVAAAEAMLRQRLGSVAVTEQGRLQGLVTSADVLSHVARNRWSAPPRAARDDRARDPSHPPLSSDEVSAYRQRLRTLLASLSRTVADVEQRALEPSGGARFQDIDESIEETALDTDLELLRAEDALGYAVREALERVGDGTFGLCESCGQWISRARLDALPYARECERCADAGAGGAALR